MINRREIRSGSLLPRHRMRARHRLGRRRRGFGRGGLNRRGMRHLSLQRRRGQLHRVWRGLGGNARGRRTQLRGDIGGCLLMGGRRAVGEPHLVGQGYFHAGRRRMGLAHRMQHQQHQHTAMQGDGQRQTHAFLEGETSAGHGVIYGARPESGSAFGPAAPACPSIAAPAVPSVTREMRVMPAWFNSPITAMTRP